MNLTQLSKDDKIKELIKDVKSKNSLRMKFYLDVSILSDQELEDFFEQVHERIDHISDAPTFQFSEVVNNKLIQKSVATQTLKFQDLQTCIGYILRSESIESSITYFYDILKTNDGSISFRSANVFDEQRRIREERNKKIDDVLNIINKPR
jgi:hypothetical protein